MSEATEVKEVTDEKQEEVKNPSEELAKALSIFKGAPDKTQIESWKQEHGEVFCSGFSETELFIWRPLTRLEFQQLQAAGANADQGFDGEALLVKTCMLWASPAGLKSLEKKAGSLITLNEQVMANSNFMDPRVAQALVIKL